MREQDAAAHEAAVEVMEPEIREQIRVGEEVGGTQQPALPPDQTCDRQQIRVRRRSVETELLLVRRPERLPPVAPSVP